MSADTGALDRVRRYCDDLAGLDGDCVVTRSQFEPNLTMADLRAVLRMASEGVR